MSENSRHLQVISLTIQVSLYNYPFIFMYDRTPWTLLLSLTCLNMPTDKIITQTIFVVQFTSRSLLHLGEIPDASSGISPRYSSATNSQLTASSLYRYNMMSNYAFLPKGSSQWGDAFLSIWGCLDIFSLLQQIHVTSITQLELSSLTSLKAWGTFVVQFTSRSLLHLGEIPRCLVWHLPQVFICH